MSSVRNVPAALSLHLPEISSALPDLVAACAELRGAADDLANSVPAEFMDTFVAGVQDMDVLFSNRIEGYELSTAEYDSAVEGILSSDPAVRDRQLLSNALLETRRAIDGGELDQLGFGSEFVREIHRKLLSSVPEDARFSGADEDGRRAPVVPGEWRASGVAVADHVAIRSDGLEGFMAHFDWGYRGRRIDRATAPLAAAAAHHRLLWIHPFMDGNGRCARLQSHALLRGFGYRTDLWSVSRGLARHETTYRELLGRADAPPQGMSDGRGTLSDGRLADFMEFFVAACIDEVGEMRRILQNAVSRRPTPGATA